MKRERVSSPAAAGVVCFSLETATCHCASRGLRLSTVPTVHRGHSRPSPNTAQFSVSMHVFYSIKGIFFKAAQHIPGDVASGVSSYVQAELSGFSPSSSVAGGPFWSVKQQTGPSYQL